MYMIFPPGVGIIQLETQTLGMATPVFASFLAYLQELESDDTIL
ncbi:hypothetical protein [Peribacillus sp. SCS-155]